MPKSHQPFWRDFATKAALTKTVRDIVNQFPNDTEFESDLLSDLIAERHWYCKYHQARPTRFKKTFGWGGGYDFWGWFESIDWHKVSWKKCITPDSVDDIIKRALRTAIRPIIEEYKAAHLTCERCGLRPVEEVHHVAPTFDEMYREAVSQLNDAEKERIMASLDWNEESEFQLPDDHPVVQSMLLSHEVAQLQAVCVPCHQECTRQQGGKSRRGAAAR